MKLKLVPQVSKGSNVTVGTGVISVDLDGGAGRYRRDVSNPSVRISASWELTTEQFEYLMAFYRSTIDEGSLSFTIDMAIFEPRLTTYTAYFVPGTLQHSQRGPVYSASATLEVVIPPVNATAADAIVSAYDASH